LPVGRERWPSDDTQPLVGLIRVAEQKNEERNAGSSIGRRLVGREHALVD
jgi:hypothetical protein